MHACACAFSATGTKWTRNEEAGNSSNVIYSYNCVANGAEISTSQLGGAWQCNGSGAPEQLERMLRAKLTHSYVLVVFVLRSVHDGDIRLHTHDAVC